MKLHFHVNGEKPEAAAQKDALSAEAARLGIAVVAEGRAADVVVALGGDGTLLRAVHEYPGVPVLGFKLGGLGYLSSVGERDFAAALAGLVVLSPVFVAVALAVKLTSRGPVFFAQTRVGRYGRHFRFYKFRSMHVDAEARKAALLARNESADGVIFKMKDDPRVTRVGRFLRRSSLDELPQLFNVLLGDMSLVGPRPPVPAEVRAYTLEDRKRLNAIPGITGPWQVSGRSDIPFHRQVQLDKDYIRSHSLWNDVKILLKTVPAILSGRGAY